jgi:hypothetical protein
MSCGSIFIPSPHPPPPKKNKSENFTYFVSLFYPDTKEGKKASPPPGHFLGFMSSPSKEKESVLALWLCFEKKE